MRILETTACILLDIGFDFFLNTQNSYSYMAYRNTDTYHIVHFMFALLEFYNIIS